MYEEAIIFDDSTASVFVPSVDYTEWPFVYRLNALNLTRGTWTQIEAPFLKDLIKCCHHRQMEPGSYCFDTCDVFHLDKLGVLTVHSKRSLDDDKQWASFRWNPK